MSIPSRTKQNVNSYFPYCCYYHYQLIYTDTQSHHNTFISEIIKYLFLINHNHLCMEQT